MRVKLVGLGRIGRPVAAFLRDADGFDLDAVLVRDASRHGDGLPVTADADAFFATGCDLVIDAAGPRALAAWGERALRLADVWSIGAAALADDALRARLEETGRRAGHCLRLLPGAVAGLDGVAAAAAQAGARVRLSMARPGAGAGFEGTAREAAHAFPDETNIAVAAALAGIGLDATRVRLAEPEEGGHRLRLDVEASYGRLDVEVALKPLSADTLHPVAASIIAALRREREVIRVG